MCYITSLNLRYYSRPQAWEVGSSATVVSCHGAFPFVKTQEGIKSVTYGLHSQNKQGAKPKRLISTTLFTFKDTESTNSDILTKYDTTELNKMDYEDNR